MPSPSSVVLPVSNSESGTSVDAEYARFFQGRVLALDERGVYFMEDGRKLYVHDQIMIVATKDGHMFDGPQPSRREMQRFVRAKGCAAVRQYWGVA
jgi:hypothetical protein